MYIAYFDESGDDGYPVYSSELFILTSIYLHSDVWKENYSRLYSFRKIIKEEYGIPVKDEFHTKEFVTDKLPYHGKYTSNVRREILFKFVNSLSSLDIKIINVAIDKKRIQRPKYDVLKHALTYNVQRIENDLMSVGEGNKFIIITDDGRVAKMRQTTRAIQKINFIPSKFDFTSYRKEIQNLIEDPLPKPSSESYFIQCADMISFLVSLYAKRHLCIPAMEWGNRIKTVLNYGDEIALMNIIKSKLNTKASSKNEYGIVYYPK